MTDLVARLREGANGLLDLRSAKGDYGLLDDAADRIEALEPFAVMGELIALETEGFGDDDELNLIVEDGHLLDRFRVGDFLAARTALSHSERG